MVALCMGCLMEWFPDKPAGWLEERLGHYIDNIDYRLAIALWKERGSPPAERPALKEWKAAADKQRAEWERNRNHWKATR